MANPTMTSNITNPNLRSVVIMRKITCVHGVQRKECVLLSLFFKEIIVQRGLLCTYALRRQLVRELDFIVQGYI